MPLSEQALEVLRHFMSVHGQTDDSALTALADQAQERMFEKGAPLLAAGDAAVVAGIVVSGLLGEFYELADGTRKCKWLAGPGEVFGSLEDLVRGGPARTTIEVLATSRIVLAPYARIRELALSQSLWAAFFVSLMEDLYRQKSEREYALLMLRAEERYGWFIERFGAMAERLSQELVASYLGITSVHLSRVRSALKVS